MPLATEHTDKAARSRRVMRIRQQIDKLQEELCTLMGEKPAAQVNDYGLTDTQMKKVAGNLHARAKKKVAEGRCKEFKGDIEAIL